MADLPARYSKACLLGNHIGVVTNLEVHKCIHIYILYACVYVYICLCTYISCVCCSVTNILKYVYMSKIHGTLLSIYKFVCNDRRDST